MALVSLMQWRHVGHVAAGPAALGYRRYSSAPAAASISPAAFLRLLTPNIRLSAPKHASQSCTVNAGVRSWQGRIWNHRHGKLGRRRNNVACTSVSPAPSPAGLPLGCRCQVGAADAARGVGSQPCVHSGLILPNLGMTLDQVRIVLRSIPTARVFFSFQRLFPVCPGLTRSA